MTAEKDETLQALDQDYQYGFKDEIEPIYTTGTGLSEEVVRQISAAPHQAGGGFPGRWPHRPDHAPAG